MKHCGNVISFDRGLDELLHPTHIYTEPRQIVDDTNLTLDEKRAILASWASDACAVEAAPALRRVPGNGRIVSVDEILEALCGLDRQRRDASSSSARRRRAGAIHPWPSAEPRRTSNVH